MYYLNSRYYDPQTGRFINADEEINANKDITGSNRFAYCSNNPISEVDPYGEAILTTMLIGAAVGFATQYLSDVISNLLNGEKGWDVFKMSSSVGDYVASTVTGAIPGGGIWSVIARVVGGATLSQGLDCLIEGKEWNWQDFSMDVLWGALGEGLSSILSLDVPENIRDIKSDAIKKGIKGTKKLTKFLKKTKILRNFHNAFTGIFANLSTHTVRTGVEILSKRRRR